MIKKAPFKLLLLQRGLSLAAMVLLFAIGGAVSHAQGLSDVALPPVTRDATRELAPQKSPSHLFSRRSGMCGPPRGPTPHWTIRGSNPCSGSCDRLT
jgi:hypothetical protein